MTNFLDKTGLSYFWEKIKDYVDTSSGGGSLTEFTGTAYVSDWSGSPPTNVVTIPGLSADVSGFIGLSNNATEMRAFLRLLRGRELLLWLPMAKSQL